ncbi:MAG: glycosyltransferase [Thermodesulfovibrionia bacterium]|nr:glycosyltransferase [Thermodesulfovibrionia bacterium]
MMTISVAIPTKNRCEDLLNTLKSILIQAYLPSEIIIVDQNISPDVNNAVLSLFNNLDESTKSGISLKYIHATEITGLAQARNVALKRNKSDILLFLDDDVLLEEDFIFHILETYRKDPSLYGVGGTITNLHQGFIGTILYKYFMRGNFTDKRMFIYSNPRYNDMEYLEVSTLPGCVMSYKKEVFQEFLFDENFIGYGLSEDFDFSFRVSRKYRLAMTPKARLEHVCSNAGRADDKKLIENVILAKHYFYKMKLHKNIYNFICYMWLHLGYAVFGFYLAVVRFNLDGLIGYTRGVRKIIRGESSDFILPGKA